MNHLVSQTARLVLITIMAFLLVGCGANNAAEPPPELGTDVEGKVGEWVKVPAGAFLKGQFEERAVVKHDFEIMVTPVTNGQFAAYLDRALARGTVTVEGGKVAGYYPGDEFHGMEHEQRIPSGQWLHMLVDDPAARIYFDGENFSVLEGYAGHPVTMVSWFGARGFCRFHGWRLPTEKQWEKAARGTDGRPYPWGEKLDGSRANYYHSGDPFEREGAIGNTTPVGFYDGELHGVFRTHDARSPYGLYDMAGNVAEWTASVYKGMHYRYLRGGSKAERWPHLRTWSRNSAVPEYVSPNAGFRCVREPE